MMSSVLDIVYRYTVCIIYKLLKVAHSQSNSRLTPLEWLEEMSAVDEMCFYWKIILKFEVRILVFGRSIREGRFKLFTNSRPVSEMVFCP